MESEETLFQAAIALPPDQRDDFLDAVCADKPDLRVRLAGLLRAHGSPGFMRDETAPFAGACETERSGDTIGRYRLIRPLGTGGFGVVWMAEQEVPVQRVVALKVLKAGMDSAEVITRFEAERQALAMMNHPNIAMVHDAGTTSRGRPYFVMELVPGIPITRFCDEHEFTTRQRLELFGDVCAAVNHAHQKGVIHRDLKPSNILVTIHAGRPLVKVIDFGIAKATQGRLTPHTLFTSFEQVVGTPAYMSPEQTALSTGDIDTRSDIYSLGILLYELITGTPPFDSRSLLSDGYQEMRRLICEVDPPRPSTRLATLVDDARTTIARTRRIAPDKLGRLVEPDLDWIVMKAIEKDRTRRYETANGLALDISRFLSDQPVSAGPPSARYRFRKFGRRHRVALRTAIALAAMLVSATAVSTWLAVRARNAEKLSLAKSEDEKSAREQAESTVRFLNQVLASPDPSRDGRSITVAELLDRAAGELESKWPGQPAQLARLRNRLGLTYRALGLPLQAIPLHEKARDYFASIDPGHPELVDMLSNLAICYADSGRIGEAIKLAEELVERRRKLNGPTHDRTLDDMNNLAGFYAEAGRRDEALAMREDVLHLRRTANGPDAPDTVRAMGNLANSYFEADRWAEGRKLSEEAMAAAKRVFGEKSPDTLFMMGTLADAYAGEQDLERSLELRNQRLDLSRDLLGPKHPDTLYAMEDLARFLEAIGRVNEALPFREQVLKARRESNQNHSSTLGAMTNLALAYRMAGQVDKAIPLQEEALRQKRLLLPAGHQWTFNAINNLARCYLQTGRVQEALDLQVEILAHLRKTRGPGDAVTQEAGVALAQSHLTVARWEDARNVMTECLQEAPDFTYGWLVLSALQAWLGESSELENTRLHSLQQVATTNQATAGDRAAKAYCLAPSSDAASLAAALELARRAVDLGKEERWFRWYLLGLGMAEFRAGHDAAALTALTSVSLPPSADSGQGSDPSSKSSSLEVTSWLYQVMCLFKQGRVSEARALFTEAEARMRPVPVDGQPPQFLVDHDDLVCWLAAREARTMLDINGPPEQNQ